MIVLYIRYSLLFIWLASCGAKDIPKIHSSESPGQSNPVIELAEIQDSFDIDYIMGKFDPASHPDFMLIPLKYADREGQYLRKDVMQAFIQMYEAATRKGVNLKIRSATRNFETQKRIWQNKWYGNTLLENGMNAAKEIESEVARAQKILEYSSMPGTSRHHWGTDIDLNSFDNQWFNKGEGLKLYTWMLENASKFGFCQPYTPINNFRPTGYFEEKWHWTYTPISMQLTTQAKSLLNDFMISGFAGSETAMEIGIVENYVLGINTECQ